MLLPQVLIRMGQIVKRTVTSLIDERYYSAQAGRDFPDKVSMLQHYIDQGQAQHLDPHPSFKTGWYLWQNPSSREFKSALHHFFEVSGGQLIDPSPMIDMVQFRSHCTLTDLGRLLNATLETRWSGFDGVYRDLTDIVWHQRYFRSQISMIVRKPMPAVGQRKPFLVWVQIGPNSSFSKWFDPRAPRNWDLLANWYVPSAVLDDLGEGIITQNGTKFTGVHNVWQAHPEFLADYEAVFFLDDDIVMRQGQMDEMFAQASSLGLDLFQPALSKGSNCVWPAFFHTPDGRDWRRTNGVEIMMPGFSARAMKTMAPLFCYSVSGFGLDLLFAKVAAANGYVCGVLNDVKVDHHKPIDQHSGAYYNLLRKYGVNSKAELWYLMNAFGLEIGFREI